MRMKVFGIKKNIKLILLYGQNFSQAILPYKLLLVNLLIVFIHTYSVKNTMIRLNLKKSKNPLIMLKLYKPFFQTSYFKFSFLKQDRKSTRLNSSHVRI